MKIKDIKAAAAAVAAQKAALGEITNPELRALAEAGIRAQEARLIENRVEALLAPFGGDPEAIGAKMAEEVDAALAEELLPAVSALFEMVGEESNHHAVVEQAGILNMQHKWAWAYLKQVEQIRYIEEVLMDAERNGDTDMVDAAMNDLHQVPHDSAGLATVTAVGLEALKRLEEKGTSFEDDADEDDDEEFNDPIGILGQLKSLGYATRKGHAAPRPRPFLRPWRQVVLFAARNIAAAAETKEREKEAAERKAAEARSRASEMLAGLRLKGL